MAVLRIRHAPDPVLKRKTTRVQKIDAVLQRLIDDMLETMEAAHGVGLAANQVGISLRLAVIGIPAEEEGQPREDYVLINPEMIKKGGERLVDEGCLSIPGYRGKLTRAEWVKVKATDREGKEYRLKAEGLLAQALEHELDHLNGALYLERMREQDTMDTLTAIDEREMVEAAAG